MARICTSPRSFTSARNLASALLLVLMACSSSTSTAPPAADGSIGAVLSRDRESGSVHIREAPSGLAGDEAGLLPGDRVKMIDGVLVDELDKDRIQGLLRGPVGTSVTLTIIRGEEVMHLEVTRQVLGKKPTLPDREERIEP